MRHTGNPGWGIESCFQRGGGCASFRVVSSIVDSVTEALAKLILGARQVKGAAARGRWLAAVVEEDSLRSSVSN